jgi:hypothetical protein
MARGMGHVRLGEIVGAFEFRWNVKALQKAGKMSSDFPHDDLAVRDSLHRLSEKVFGTSVIPGWRPVQIQNVTLLDCFTFANTALKNRDPSPPSPGPSSSTDSSPNVIRHGSRQVFQHQVAGNGRHLLPATQGEFCEMAAEARSTGQLNQTTQSGLITVNHSVDAIAEKEHAQQLVAGAGLHGILAPAAGRQSA